MTKINKIRLQYTVGIILSLSTLTGLGYTYILQPQICNLIDSKVEMSVGKKVDILIQKVDDMDKKTTASQSNTDIKFESIDGKLNLIQYRLDSRK